MTFVWFELIALIFFAIIAGIRYYNRNKPWTRDLLWYEGIFLGIFFGAALGVLCVL